MTSDHFSKSLTYIAVIGGNLIPFYGVYAWGWDIFSIFFLYWAENMIIGLFMLLMMAIVSIRNGVVEIFGGLFMMGFFTVHYGMFCMGHLAILTSLFGPEDLKGQMFSPEDLKLFLVNPHIQGFYIAFAGIAVAQAFQFFDLFRKEFIHAGSAGELMVWPYGRIIVLHMAILLGGFVTLGLGSPVWALVVLMGLKTLYDVGGLKIRNPDENKSEVKDERPEENPAVIRTGQLVAKILGKFGPRPS